MNRSSCAILSLLAFLVVSTSGGAQQPPSASSRIPHYRIPERGKIPVAFVISDDAVTIDFAGP
jgi:hypothetical protein